LYFE